MSRDPLTAGRSAFEREAWLEAFTDLSSADRRSPLDAEDLDCLATAAFLVGEDTASADARARAHTAFLDRGDILRAARSAFWLAFAILDKPAKHAQASGWLARVRRLLDDCPEECAEQGFWLCSCAFQKAVEGDVAAAQAAFADAARIGARVKDRDLIALARHGEGRALLRLEKTVEGLATLDEVMVSVTCGEVGPMVAGVVYCSVIGACYERFDLRRAQEWTTALAGWCAAHPDMVPFRGDCLVHRSELLQLHGAWPEAIGEAQRAVERLEHTDGRQQPGAAYYQQAELHRLRGEFEEADAAYRRASQAGRKPDPGPALLRLAQGQTAAAAVAIRRVLQETHAPRARAHALRAGVEIMLACQDVAAARATADELTRMAETIDAPLLRASALQASGAVAIALGEANRALDSLRQAWTIWRELDAPYEVARTRALIGLASKQLGDEEGARIELEAAQDIFERLGAAPDVARMETLLARAATPASGPLTGRELEVLRLVAAGRTNRAIAAELSISEKTVARHVSNIFTKLDLSSRAAATAYAYSHHLV